MERNGPKRKAKTPKRNHHGRRVEELSRQRKKRRLARLEGPDRPLAEAPPSLWDIRDALAAARGSGRAALRLGWLVHRLKRTAGNEGDRSGVTFWWDTWKVEDEHRVPSVRGSLYDSRFDEETLEDEDIDLSDRYKTLMRHKRIWERFADRFGLDRATDPDATFASWPPAARSFLDRHGATAASILRGLATVPSIPDARAVSLEVYPFPR